MNKYLQMIRDPEFRLSILASRGFYNSMSDEKFLKKKYRLIFGTEPNLLHPKTFNEKLQWLKLYDREPLYTTLVDKYAVRQYIADKLGEEYLVPLAGGPWEKVEDIDFDALPRQFVLKCTHDSGGVLVVKDKSALNVDVAKSFLNKRLARNYFYGCREWPYKDLRPRIYAEKFMQNADEKALNVYKLMCFGGTPKIFQVIQNDKLNSETVDYFDTDWNLLNMRQNFPNSAQPLAKPECIQDLLQLAEKLSSGFPFLRTDFYVVDGRVFFSELTFYSDGGFACFDPPEWDKILGSWIELPER